MQQQLCGARQGEVGVSCLTVPNCGLSCSLQSSLQLHMRRSTSVTALGGRAGSPAQQLSWNTILASVDVNVPVMLETSQRYSFQEQVRYTRSTLLFSSVTLVIIVWCVELIVL